MVPATLRQRSAVINVLTLMAGTGLAQVFPILITPLLTRQYAPAEFGIVALYIALTSALCCIATGRYELAIILPRRDRDAAILGTVSILISAGLAFLTIFPALLFPEEIASLVGASSLSPWLPLIPVAIITAGFYQSCNYLLSRKNQYKQISAGRVTQALTGSLVSLGAGHFEASGGLILGVIAGQIFGAILFWNGILCRPVLLRKREDWLRALALVRKYRKFPAINAPHSFVNYFKDGYVTSLISVYYSSGVLGQYYLVVRIMKAPVSLIGSAIAQVFLRDAASDYAKGRSLEKRTKRLVSALFLISSVPALISIFYGDVIFTFLFGNKWNVAGEICRALAPYIFFHFVASPLGMVPIVAGRQGAAFFWGMAESILFLLCFIVGGIIFGSLIKSAWLLSAVMAMFFCVYFFWIVSIVKEK